jgi:hypothetical protein
MLRCSADAALSSWLSILLTKRALIVMGLVGPSVGVRVETLFDLNGNCLHTHTPVLFSACFLDLIFHTTGVIL